MAEADIFRVHADYRSVVVKLIPDEVDGRPFYVQISADGFEFFDRVSSSGVLEGNPIHRTASQILDWIGDDGASKKFRDRAAIRPKRK